MKQALYTLNRVEKRYGTRTVLRIPELQIMEGEIFALVGPSGAGKSTLLRLLALLEAPTQGTLTAYLNGRDVAHNEATIADRRQLAMVFQRPVLLSRSVRANIAYGLRLRGEKDARQRVNNALARVALTPLADAQPRTLSGGEVQRVSLARALVLEPRILLLDEPTANLDQISKVRTLKLLQQFKQRGIAMIIASHDPDTFNNIQDERLLLQDARLTNLQPRKKSGKVTPMRYRDSRSA